MLLKIITSEIFLDGLLGEVLQRLGELDGEDVRVPQGRLHDGPVGHTAVAGHGVEVEVSVQVVLGPFDLFGFMQGTINITHKLHGHCGTSYLPNDVLMLSVLGRGEVARLLHVNLEVDEQHNHHILICKVHRSLRT